MAIFRSKPSPFCILDEVDAALDDANIDRFLAMLGGFRANTQFIVVTHNKGTMSACQSLYGVTMETKGVSRQVAVELSDVERWAGPLATGRSEMPVEASAGGEPAPARESEARTPPEIDADTGEPVVELVPTNVVEGEMRAPSPRRAERRSRRKSAALSQAEAAAPSESSAVMPSIAIHADAVRSRETADGQATEAKG
jgi:hypothetical protein